MKCRETIDLDRSRKRALIRSLIEQLVAAETGAAAAVTERKTSRTRRQGLPDNVIPFPADEVQARD